MTDSNQHRLHGDCADCGTCKNTFIKKDWVIKKSEKDEKAYQKVKQLLRIKCISYSDVHYYFSNVH
jgi:hypothetical protein